MHTDLHTTAGVRTNASLRVATKPTSWKKRRRRFNHESVAVVCPHCSAPRLKSNRSRVLTQFARPSQAASDACMVVKQGVLGSIAPHRNSD